jgi:hypothetical protein
MLLEGVMFGMRAPPLFTCTVCPTGHMGDSTLHKDVSLVFFNAFEPIRLTPDSLLLLLLLLLVSRKLYAEEGRSVLLKGGFSGAIALCLPSGKRPWTGASDSLLPERQLSQYNSLLLQG